ncbi:hypothetical protein [Lutibacter sp.]
MKNLNKHMHSKLKEKHSKELGLKVPDNYFSVSKSAILNKVSEEKKVKRLIFKRERMVWMAAASIALIFTITVFKTNVFSTIDKAQAVVVDTIEQLKNEVKAMPELNEDNDILIASLFVEDSKVEDFVNEYVLEEIVNKELLAE